MASHVHHTRANRATTAPTPNIAVYQTNRNQSQRISRKDLKGSELVNELSATCLEAMRWYKLYGGPTSSVINQFESMQPKLVKQLQLIELANDSEIEPMKGLIVGTLADIATTLRALIVAKKDDSDEKKNRLEESFSELLDNAEVKGEALEEPEYAEDEDNRTGQKDLVEMCGRDIESLLSTLEDLQPVFFNTKEFQQKNRNLWAEFSANEERNTQPPRTTRVQVQAPSEYARERRRVAEPIDLSEERERMFERKQYKHYEHRQMPTIHRGEPSTTFHYKETSRRMSPSF